LVPAAAACGSSDATNAGTDASTGASTDAGVPVGEGGPVGATDGATGPLDGGAHPTDGGPTNGFDGSGDAGNGGGDHDGGSTDASAPPTDYPYCNYGPVPSGTPPATWNDNPTLTPTGVNPYGQPATTVAAGYLLISEGPQGTAQVPKATQSSILGRINDDLKFETSVAYIHLPAWSTGATGSHYIDYLFVGTGLPQDPNSGGDSSWEGSYPDVETTSVAMTDATQRYDVTHEFNHVIENAYGTVPGPKVSWIQESYNDYLILLVAERDLGATPGQATQVSLPQNVAYLDSLVYQQPFVPIESCGISTQNGSSVNGPADYFTDITGFRYNDLFPLFIAQRVGQHFFAAVWEQAKTSEQILQTMARLTDQGRVQCMVQEYAARLALGDFQELSTSIQGRASATMYEATTNTGGVLRPSNASHLPRYTGRNNIPIAVDAGATQLSVTFQPDAAGSNGTPSDMRAQIVYRATDGSAVFSPPVNTGTTTVTLTKPPKNGVVVVVVSNVTMSGYKKAGSYGWDPNETFGYGIQVTGGTPAPTGKLYF
jgi:hypothetical protein